MSETKNLLLFIDENCLKQNPRESKTARIKSDKAAGDEMAIQDNCTVCTSVKELEHVILNRYLSEEQKSYYYRKNLTNTCLPLGRELSDFTERYSRRPRETEMLFMERETKSILQLNFW